MKDKIYLIGPIDLGNVPTNGVTMKNQLFYKRFSELFDVVRIVDSWNISKKPWVLLQIIWAILFHPQYKFIISGGNSSRHIFNFIYKFGIKRNMYFWVAGGNLQNKIKEGIYNKRVLNYLNAVIVQGKSMRDELIEMGVINAVYVPNSKPINYTPILKDKSPNTKIHFVFLSRIHPDKGCDDIFEASRRLNKLGYEDMYDISFYGPVFDTYADSFYKQISEFPNVTYNGFLDLTKNDGYAKLSCYDVMLFPTYWPGEGFPGIVVDSYIAGLPIIASDWNLNKEVVEDGKTGFIIETKNVDMLCKCMTDFITSQAPLYVMRQYCVKHVCNYDFRNVLSEQLMQSLGFK